MPDKTTPAAPTRPTPIKPSVTRTYKHVAHGQNNIVKKKHGNSQHQGQHTQPAQPARIGCYKTTNAPVDERNKTKSRVDKTKGVRDEENADRRNQEHTLGNLVIHDITKGDSLPAVGADFEQTVQATTSLLHYEPIRWYSST